MTVGCALSACGGGGGTPTPTSAPAPNPVAGTSTPPVTQQLPRGKTVVRVGMNGDSTVVGYTFDPTTQTYFINPQNEPSSLQYMFDRDFGPGKVIVNNHGVGGTTCSELLWGQVPFTQTWQQDMSTSTDDIEVVNEAINDWETDVNFSACYTMLGQTVAQYGKAFVIESPNPIGYPSTQAARLAQLSADEQTVAGQLGVPFTNSWALISTYYPNWIADEPDQIHPDAALYWYKALLTYQTLKPMVETELSN